MGISTIPMSAFVSKSQQNKKGQPSLYLGLGFALDRWKFFFFLARIKDPPCCGCEGGGCRRLIEAEAEVTGAICVECVDWKSRVDN